MFKNYTIPRKVKSLFRLRPFEDRDYKTVIDMDKLRSPLIRSKYIFHYWFK